MCFGYVVVILPTLLSKWERARAVEKIRYFICIVIYIYIVFVFHSSIAFVVDCVGSLLSSSGAREWLISMTHQVLL